MFAFVPIAGAMGYTLDAISDGFSGDPTLNSRSECKHVATGASLWTIRGKRFEPASAGDRLREFCVAIFDSSKHVRFRSHSWRYGLHA